MWDPIAWKYSIICQNVDCALVLRLVQQYFSCRASISVPFGSLSSLSAKSKASNRISIDIPYQPGSSSLHFELFSLSNSQPIPRRCIITDGFGCARDIPAIIGYGLVPRPFHRGLKTISIGILSNFEVEKAELLFHSISSEHFISKVYRSCFYF